MRDEAKAEAGGDGLRGRLEQQSGRQSQAGAGAAGETEEQVQDQPLGHRSLAPGESALRQAADAHLEVVQLEALEERSDGAALADTVVGVMGSQPFMMSLLRLSLIHI